MKKIKKIISLFIILAFLCNQVIPAEQLRTQSDRKTAIGILLDTTLPPQFGHVWKRFTGTGDKTIIHIQDAHCNFQAQKNIAELLKLFSREFKKAGLRKDVAVFVEGAAGTVDTSFFGSFPYLEVKKDVLTDYMMRGLVTGPEYLSIVEYGIFPITLTGVEDPELYIKNFFDYRQTFPNQEIDEYFDILFSSINELKKKVYSSSLLECDRMCEDYASGDLGIGEFISYLGSVINFDESPYSNIRILLRSLEEGSAINYKDLEEERLIIFSELEEKLTKDQVSELLKKTLEFRLGKISDFDYYQYLASLISSNGLSLANFPQTNSFLSFLKVRSQLDYIMLTKEIDHARKAALNSFVTTDEEQKLAEIGENVELLKKLLHLHFAREDIELFNNRKETISLQQILTDIEKMMNTYSLDIPYEFQDERLQSVINEKLACGEEFYKGALKRDHVIIKNTLEAMARQGVNVGFLVTGGFHSEGITKKLRDKNISHIVVVPTISELGEETEKLYLSLMMDKRITQDSGYYFHRGQTGRQAIGYMSQFNNLMSLLSSVIRMERLEKLVHDLIDRFLTFAQSKGIDPAELIETWAKAKDKGKRIKDKIKEITSEDVERIREVALDVSIIYSDVRENYGKVEAIIKEDKSAATVADFLSQIHTVVRINELFPDDAFVGEEKIDTEYLRELLSPYPELLEKYGEIINVYESIMQRPQPEEKPASYWISDPLDGTSEYLRGGNKFAFSLARASWDPASGLYKVDYGVAYAPFHEIQFGDQVVKGPLVEVLRERGTVTLSEAVPGEEIRTVVDSVRFSREDDERSDLAWKIVLRDYFRPQFRVNPYQEALAPVYGEDHIVKEWMAAVTGMLGVLCGNYAIYHGDMSIWDYAAVAFMIQMAGGEVYRKDNGRLFEGFTENDIEQAMQDKGLEVIVSRGGVHGGNTRKAVQKTIQETPAILEEVSQERARLADIVRRRIASAGPAERKEIPMTKEEITELMRFSRPVAEEVIGYLRSYGTDIDADTFAHAQTLFDELYRIAETRPEEVTIPAEEEKRVLVEDILNNRFIKGFGSIKGSEAEKDIGTKVTNLALLFNAGIPVLPGSGITREALHEFLLQEVPNEGKTLSELIKELTSRLDIDSPDEDYHIIEQSIRDYILATPFPKDLGEAIKSAYSEMARSTGFDSFSVRSSSISIGKDSLSRLFPGMFQSVLNRKGEEQVLEGIKEVWISQWSKGALRFRFENGMSQTDVDMGVGMQAQLKSEISGVFYTQVVGSDPLGPRIGELTAGKGLGTGVVEGKMTPDWYRVTAEGTILSQRIGTQAFHITVGDEGGTIRKKLKRRKQPLLDEEQILNLNSQIDESVKKFEETGGLISPFGYDVEWAFHKGRFYIFQLRPIPIPTHHTHADLYNILARISISRDVLINLAGLFQKEEITDTEFKKILPELIAIKKNMANRPELQEDWQRLLDKLKEKMVIKTEFFKIADYMIDTYHFLQSQAVDEFEDASALDDVYGVYLGSLGRGRKSPIETQDISFIQSRIEKIEASGVPGLYQAYRSMIINVPLKHFDKGSLHYALTVGMKDEKSAEIYEALFIRIFSDWENIEKLSLDSVQGLMDFLWENLFKERPHLHELFRDGIRKLFLDTESDDEGIRLRHLKKIHTKALLTPFILEERYPELGSIFGADLNSAIFNLINDYRFRKDITLVDFFKDGWKLLFGPLDFERSFSGDAFFNKYPFSEVFQVIPYLAGEKQWESEHGVTVKTKDGRERLYNNDEVRAVEEKCASFIILRRELPKILENPGFWRKLSLDRIKKTAAFLTVQQEMPAMTLYMKKGLGAILKSGRIVQDLFYKEVEDKLLAEEWGDVELDLLELQLPVKVKAKYDRMHADMSGLANDFRAYGMRVLDTGSGLKSNVYDLLDALRDASSVAVPSNDPKKIDIALAAIKSILKMKGYHGQQWRNGYDDEIRPPSHEEKWEGYHGSSDGAFYHEDQQAHMVVRFSLHELFEKIKTAFDDLREKLDPERQEFLDTVYYEYFCDYFLPPFTEGIDVDDTMRVLNQEVLNTAVYSPNPKMRIVKRLFIEKAQNIIPGCMLVGTDWRIMHNEFEDLETLAPPDGEELIKRLHRLRLNIHNVLDSRILDDAQDIYQDITTEGHEFYIPGNTRLHERLGELVGWLERMYKGTTGQVEDLDIIKGMIDGAFVLKMERAFKNTEYHYRFYSKIEKIRSELTGHRPIRALIEIESLRVALQEILANPEMNGMDPDSPIIFTTEERLGLIRLELAFERMESGIAGNVAEQDSLAYEDIMDYARWLLTTLLLSRESFAQAVDIIPRVQLFIAELSKKNLTAARDLWKEIRASISQLPDKRQVLSFILFEHGAQQLDRFFFKEEIIPIAPGSASGRVRIIKDYESEHELEKLINDPVNGIRPDEVLVLKEIPRVINIEPEHMPAGIIVEEGSIVSHASSAVRQGEMPVPTIVAKGIMDTLNEYDYVKFEVSEEMDAVKVTTKNLDLKDITARLGSRIPNSVINGWAQGQIKVIHLKDSSSSEEFESAWEDADMGPEDLIVVDTLDYVNLDYILKTHGFPAGIIVSKGSKLTYASKVITRMASSGNISIPVVQIDDATTLFDAAEGQFYALASDENGVRIYKSMSDDRKVTEYTQLETVASGSDEKTGVQYLYNTRVAVSNIEGDFARYEALLNEIRHYYKDAPLLYFGDYLGRGSSGVLLLENIFKEGGGVEKGRDIALLGNREALFLKAMFGGINDLWEFLNEVGYETVHEVGLVMPYDPEKITESDLSLFQNHPRLSDLARRVHKYAKIYHRENDTLFVHSGIPFTPDGKPVSYRSSDGRVFRGILALKIMQRDFNENTVYFLGEVLKNRTPVLAITDREKERTWQDQISDVEQFNRVAEKFFVQRIAAAGGTTGKFAGKILDLNEGAVLFFDDYGIRRWYPHTGEVKNVEVIEAATAAGLSRTIGEAKIPVEIRHVGDITEMKEILALFEKLGLVFEDLGPDSRWMVAVDPASDKIIGGFYYRVEGGSARFGEIAVVPEMQGKGIGTALLRAFFQQISFEGIKTYTIGPASVTEFFNKVKLRVLVHGSSAEKEVTGTKFGVKEMKKLLDGFEIIARDGEIYTLEGKLSPGHETVKFFMKRKRDGAISRFSVLLFGEYEMTGVNSISLQLDNITFRRGEPSLDLTGQGIELRIYKFLRVIPEGFVLHSEVVNKETKKWLFEEYYIDPETGNILRKKDKAVVIDKPQDECKPGEISLQTVIGETLIGHLTEKAGFGEFQVKVRGGRLSGIDAMKWLLEENPFVQDEVPDFNLFAVKLPAASFVKDMDYFDFLRRYSVLDEAEFSDQLYLISNEKNGPDLAPLITERTGKGGVFIGTSLEQNFSYAAGLEPDLVVIMDKNRYVTEVVLPVLGELMKRYETRLEYLARMLSKDYNSDVAFLEETKKWNLGQLMDYLKQQDDKEYPEFNDIVEEILPDEIKDTGSAFWMGEDGLRKEHLSLDTAYKEWMSLEGDVINAHWLNDRSKYMKVRNMWMGGLIKAVSGNWSGETPQRVAGLVKAAGIPVNVIYLSNIHDHIMGDDLFEMISENVKEFNLRDNALVMTALEPLVAMERAEDSWIHFMLKKHKGYMIAREAVEGHFRRILMKLALIVEYDLLGEEDWEKAFDQGVKRELRLLAEYVEGMYPLYDIEEIVTGKLNSLMKKTKSDYIYRKAIEVFKEKIRQRDGVKAFNVKYLAFLLNGKEVKLPDGETYVLNTNVPGYFQQVLNVRLRRKSDGVLSKESVLTIVHPSEEDEDINNFKLGMALNEVVFSEEEGPVDISGRGLATQIISYFHGVPATTRINIEVGNPDSRKMIFEKYYVDQEGVVKRKTDDFVVVDKRQNEIEPGEITLKEVFSETLMGRLFSKSGFSMLQMKTFQVEEDLEGVEALRWLLVNPEDKGDMVKVFQIIAEKIPEDLSVTGVSMEETEDRITLGNMVSMGGNSLLTGKDVGDVDPKTDDGFRKIREVQKQRVKDTLRKIIPTLVNGGIITHGNGPEAGVLLERRREEGQSFEELVGQLAGVVKESQKWIAEDIVEALRELSDELGIDLPEVEFVYTHVGVDPDDSGFQNPTKPVGIKPKEGPDTRPRVASPKPLKIIETERIKRAVKKGKIVICVGGGGIPVNYKKYLKTGELEYLPAVIDKDLATVQLTKELSERGPPVEVNIKRLIISTAVPAVYINFGKPDQTALGVVTPEQMDEYIKEGHFTPGSMLPKVEAAIDAVRTGVADEVVITNPEHISQIDGGGMCTRIIPSLHKSLGATLAGSFIDVGLPEEQNRKISESISSGNFVHYNGPEMDVQTRFESDEIHETIGELARNAFLPGYHQNVKVEMLVAAIEEVTGLSVQAAKDVAETIVSRYFEILASPRTRVIGIAREDFDAHFGGFADTHSVYIKQKLLEEIVSNDKRFPDRKSKILGIQNVLQHELLKFLLRMYQKETETLIYSDGLGHRIVTNEFLDQSNIRDSILQTLSDTTQKKSAVTPVYNNFS